MNFYDRKQELYRLQVTGNSKEIGKLNEKS